jgi:hypothetical protein
MALSQGAMSTKSSLAGEGKLENAVWKLSPYGPLEIARRRAVFYGISHLDNTVTALSHGALIVHTTNIHFRGQPWGQSTTPRLILRLLLEEQHIAFE